ncbi:CBS domain-containing protein [Halorientalis marina]|jgi:predicted transcriptional regulator|uniref:CBS domain-containing protein n=1 Tax=Halorientalis marina TaxID=2931976 RepID=UPI001FF5CB3B|nr:CBS domain-containing protein [Halorientalis marina]
MDVERLERPVSEIMTSPARTVDPEMAVTDAARILWHEGIGALIVETDEVAGIVTESDVVRGVCASHDPEQLRVRELMTDLVITVGPEETIRDASVRMQDNDIKKLPVVDDTGTLVGVVTTTDIAESIAPSFDDVLAEFAE